MTADVNKGSTLTEEEQVVSTKSLKRHELSEQEMPEEMKSEKKFKEVFKPEGWEGLGNEIELPEELTEEKLQPILKRLSLAGEENQNSFKGWGWGNWGVSSLLTTATAGVSTLTSHVSHGLTLLEESIAATEEPKSDETSDKDDSASIEEYSFGFGNLMSGVSSITKLVESTGSKVMTGGLDTLEAIGKKTMEVLQEGDPGLKKKRAIFKIEADKPILSQVLREAKDKAETVEKTIEEKQKMRKVHFESLFDDYQGLVHLEALEMLSKQSNIKIQQHLIGLNTTELNSVQETLEEVKELCDLGDDDEKDGEITDLKVRLQEICNDLGVNITYERLHTICEESEAYLAPAVTHTDEEIFEHAISILVQFTAFSVERFHKTAELLLIKERRSTVNEADALVQLTHILSNKIGILANTYCDSLHTLSKTKDTPDNIKTNVTTIFMEASNASSYVQDAFKLLIPIIQVGAI
ncbi:PREDICTED: protein FAM114A2 [Dufourea novaeangliae]|uniref:protein FAM114A2 n=1 Tax=Dufourea novaeangliae TaxID=178035 RepID=UPI0007671D28|nr:PREDICTED: protein FAM114A2 [Dufourea novaeangliae]